MLEYIETAKECPKCHEQTLFFCTMITKVTDHKFEGSLGVRCHNSKCDYQAILIENKEKAK